MTEPNPDPNPNAPFSRYPGQKMKTLPYTTFKNTYVDEVMPDLSLALQTKEAHGKLPPLSSVGGEFPPGSMGWYRNAMIKYRDSNMNFPHRDYLPIFSTCDTSDACPFGVAKKPNVNDTPKPILTVEKLVEISITDSKYHMHLGNMRNLQKEQAKDFAVPSVACYEFLKEGGTHKSQTHLVTDSGKLVPLKNPGSIEDANSDEEDDDEAEGEGGNGNAVVPAIDPRVFNSPVVQQALGIVQQSVVASQQVIAQNETILKANGTVASTNKLAQTDIHTGLSVAMTCLNAAGINLPSNFAGGGIPALANGYLPAAATLALPPIEEGQAQNDPLSLPAATVPSSSSTPMSTPGKKAGKKATPKKGTPKKAAARAKKVATPKKTPKKASTPRKTPSSTSSTPKKATPASTHSTPTPRRSGRSTRSTPSASKDMNRLD